MLNFAALCNAPCDFVIHILHFLVTLCFGENSGMSVTGVSNALDSLPFFNWLVVQGFTKLPSVSNNGKSYLH